MAKNPGRDAEHPALAQLRGYWEGLRAGGDLPSRAQIDPRGIERALEYAFIAERMAPGVARFRLAGMHLNDLMGMEVRGMPITALFEPVVRDEVQRQIERAFADPAAVELTLESARGIGRPALTARLLLLPLRTETGEVARVLGGLVAEGGIGRAPRRFRLSGAEASVIEPDWAEPLMQAAEDLRQPGFAEARAGFEAAPAIRSRGHLRLVHSRD